MKHSEGRFAGAGQRAIYFQCWEPETSPRAVLLIVHGAGEHSARYERLARFFNRHDYAVAALDHNGHGHSEGTPGYVSSFEDYLSDLGEVHRQVAARFAQVPVFLLGHSMGGLIASKYLLLQQAQFQGAILSASSIMSVQQPGPVQRFLIRLLAVLAPRLGLLQLDAAGVSRDPEEVKKYVEDPLVLHGKLSARLLRELMDGMNAIQAEAAGIALPVLLLHGGADVMTAPEGSCFLHDHISSADKTLKIYPGLYHEIFNEPEREAVLTDVLNWCEARLGGRRGPRGG
jgi:alpha-beta hydrolase superfamily lysophospholipase